jgi:hypothetical protein
MQLNSVIFMPVLLTLYAPSVGTGKCCLSISFVANRRVPVRQTVSFQLIDTREVNDALISSNHEDGFEQLSALIVQQILPPIFGD